MLTRFGHCLKDWRRRRGMSQLGLALAADVSARHIAFLETGRANPTRAMIGRLAETLDVPFEDRNAMLEAAGFAAAYRSCDLASTEMEGIRAALEWTLHRHAPYPAFALDRDWRLSGVNRTAGLLLSAAGVAVGDSMIEALLGPWRLSGAIENWSEVAAHLWARWRTESRHAGGVPALDAAADRLSARLGEPAEEAGVLPALVTTRYRVEAATLTLFSTIAQFGSAQDVALSNLKIELLFPADEPTRLALVAMARC